MWYAAFKMRFCNPENAKITHKSMILLVKVVFCGLAVMESHIEVSKNIKTAVFGREKVSCHLFS